MQFDILLESITPSLQRLNVLMWCLPVVQMTAQLRNAAGDGLIRRCPPAPDFIDKLLFGDEVGVASCQRHQYFEDLRLRALLLITVTRENFPFPKGETRQQFLFFWHPVHSQTLCSQTVGFYRRHFSGN